MNIKKLFATRDIDNCEFSLLLVDPNERFWEWHRSYAKQRGLERDRFDVPEENAVLIIPQIGRFTEPGSLEKFLDDLKPKVLLEELRRLLVSPADFEHPITKESFDEIFSTTIRAYVCKAW